MRSRFPLFYLFLLLPLMMSCGPRVPETFSTSKELPVIYPDYTNVTVPVNIAPLTFEADVAADELVASFKAGTEEVVCGGDKVQPSMDEWKRLVDAALTLQPPARLCRFVPSGQRTPNTHHPSSITVDVYMRRGEQWTRYQPFHIYVSPDSIDPYISYRLISPSYVSYEDLTINQRCLENYDEQVIYDNMLCSEEGAGQCVNCHNYQQYNPERMQFHARQHQGGTIIAYDGEVSKINMKNDSLLSAGVYPAWHPWLKLIVYSTNHTHQSFHTTRLNKIEVFDSESDMMVYNLETNEVTNIENDPDEFEVFPFWAPDGKTLYYCSAHFVYTDSIDRGMEVISRGMELKYNIYKKSFDPATLQFGERELVFDAASMDKSATLPRISPDGRFLVFAMAQYGVFHIWHHDADLWMLDLQTGNAAPMKEVNSSDTESYHAWSSNGRWLVFSSRRDDGNYTRPFFAHIDKDGHASKPFELPCADPDYHRQFLKCYNIPEFMSGPVTIKPQRFADILKTEGKPVKYVPLKR